MPHFSDSDLLAFLDEALPVERMTAIEQELRASEPLRRHLAELVNGQEQTGHSVSQIWRRERLSCPTRRQLGSYLLGALEPQLGEYVRFHIETAGCRYCAANLADLQQAAQPTEAAAQRRQKFFQSSAGQLRREA